MSPSPNCPGSADARCDPLSHVDHESKPEEVAADVDVQRLDGARIFVESTRLVPFGDNKITPFLTNVSFDVAAIC